MKRFCAFFTCIFLVGCSLSLFGCDSSETKGRSGIIISEEEEYSDDVVSRAEAIIYDLIEHYVRSNEAVTLPETTVRQIERISGDMAGVISEVPLSEECFFAVLDACERYGKDAVSEMKNKTYDRGSFREFYTAVCAAAGHDYLCKTFYRVLEYSFDYRYEKRAGEYEKYGFPYLLEEANAAKRDKEILTSEVGEENFISFVSGAAAVSGLWLGDGFDPENSASFTDEEILVFISEIDFSLELSNEGWRVLLSHVVPSIPDEDGFVNASLENGDITKLSSVMNSLTQLISSIQSSLTVDEVKMLRQSEREKFIETVFGMFSDKDWDLFSALTSVELSVDQYELLCEQKYGEDFVRYREAVLPLTLSELKDSVGKENFYESLERYVGGISPAFSYGMRK